MLTRTEWAVYNITDKRTKANATNEPPQARQAPLGTESQQQQTRAAKAKAAIAAKGDSCPSAANPKRTPVRACRKVNTEIRAALRWGIPSPIPSAIQAGAQLVGTQPPQPIGFQGRIFKIVS